ncbi:MAG: hypothetical protein EXR71_12960 [Myxococcales bacterium]|nr:hypothetical protein [Myxococcales bacterium]
MSWFDRHAGDDPETLYERLRDAVGASGLEDALTAASGLTGHRRYVLRAEVRDGRMRVVSMEGTTLPRGGGPPAATAWAANSTVVDAALNRLRRLLPRGLDVGSMALGVVRHAEGPLELSLRFDEDAPGLSVGQLTTPTGEPSPTEDPAWLRVLAAWSTRIDEMRSRFVVARGEWSLSAGRLDDGERRVAATALGSWHAGQRRFEWLLASPAGDEAPLVEPALTVDLAGAIELVCFAAAKLGATGVVQGTLPTGELVFVAVRG